MSYRTNWGRQLPEPDRDYGDETPEQLELDVPALRECECTAVDKRHCLYDLNKRIGNEHGKRPRTCLRRVDPATTPWPEGY